MHTPCICTTHTRTNTHSLALSSSPLPLTLSLWPWASAASGCCWDFCVGGWRADGERLGQGSHNFHPSIHPFILLMNEKKKFFPLCWQMAVGVFLGTHEEFIYYEAPLWIPAPSASSFIFKLCVNAVFKKAYDWSRTKQLSDFQFLPRACCISALSARMNKKKTTSLTFKLITNVRNGTAVVQSGSSSNRKVHVEVFQILKPKVLPIGVCERMWNIIGCFEALYRLMSRSAPCNAASAISVWTCVWRWQVSIDRKSVI